ncbi:MAG: ABC transporter substrate-binding protein, partial [Rhizobiales bacterium]|nr:ABC transporter substrate-binding protein [Hyphomicrobiales bacterium]
MATSHKRGAYPWRNSNAQGQDRRARIRHAARRRERAGGAHKNPHGLRATARTSRADPVSGRRRAAHCADRGRITSISFRGTTPAIQALAAQELDIASQSPSSFALAVQNAKVDIKIVGDTFQDNGKTHYASPFMVLKDSGINKIEDLKGKRIASNAIGSASDTGMRRMLARHGIGEKDFNTIETAFGNMPAMLLSKKVDMIVVLPQFQRLLDKDREKVKSLFSMRDAVGAQQTIMWVARADSMAKNRAAWVDYF